MTDQTERIAAERLQVAAQFDVLFDRVVEGHEGEDARQARQALLDTGDDRPSAIADVVRAELAAAASDDGEFELDFSLIGYDRIFQDIVRRCPDLDHIQIVAAWTCTHMRPDGVGGMATVITSDAIESMSTTSFIEQVLARLADP